MQVFKFGGASVKDAAGVRNVANIVAQYTAEPLVVIVSAMGKTTNALETVVDAYTEHKGNAGELLTQIQQQHLEIASQLFPPNHIIFATLQQYFAQVEQRFAHPPTDSYGYEYDQIVSLGEIVSSVILSAYLNEAGVNNEWLDVRQLIRTDNTYREGQINWKETSKCVEKAIPKVWNEGKVVVTQGFLGGTVEGFTTTLGREGSDYTGAVFANLLDAKRMTVWKDVPGILNADPRLFAEAVQLPVLSYYEAIEMTYYGAHVIHPKTIKPLQNKDIPLHVRSFIHPDEVGTVIQSELPADANLPTVMVVKKDQLLLSIFSNDFSFMAEENLSDIYDLFADHRIKTNLTQNGAISFSACIDNTPTRIKDLIEELEAEYTLKRNEGLELLTLRHYTPEAIAQYTEGREVLMEQKTRHTLQMVVR